MNYVKDTYPDGECPDCGEEIPEEAVSGSECENCGHVFFLDHEDDDSDPGNEFIGWALGTGLF